MKAAGWPVMVSRMWHVIGGRLDVDIIAKAIELRLREYVKMENCLFLHCVADGG